MNQEEKDWEEFLRSHPHHRACFYLGMDDPKYKKAIQNTMLYKSFILNQRLKELFSELNPFK